MKIKQTGNEGQFIHEGESLVSHINPGETLPIETYINKKRFTKLLHVHKDKYKSPNAFWEMFIRDLFEVNK